MGLIKLFVKLAFLLFVVLVYIITVNINTMNTRAHYETNVDTITVEDLEEGDIIFVRKNIYSGMIPGYWSHTAIYEGVDENKTAWVIQAESFEKVERVTLEKVLDDKMHIMVGKVNTSDEIKKKAVEWASSKINLSFDYFYPSKQLEGKSYYCSELIWGAYKNQKLELDTNPTTTLRYLNGVAPQEIFINKYVEVFNLENY